MTSKKMVTADSTDSADNSDVREVGRNNCIELARCTINYIFHSSCYVEGQGKAYSFETLGIENFCISFMVSSDYFVLFVCFTYCSTLVPKLVLFMR